MSNFEKKKVLSQLEVTIFKNTDPKIKDTFVSDFVLPTPKNPENLRFVGWRASKDPSAAIITKENMLGFYLLAEIGHVTLYPKWEVIPKELKTVTEVIEPTKEYVIDETRDKGAKNERIDKSGEAIKEIVEKDAQTIESWYTKSEHKRHLPITIYDDFWK